MTQQDYLKDISEIKDLMNKSSRFISLSGLSGILAGIYALIGAGIAYGWIYDLKESIETFEYHETSLIKSLINGYAQHPLGFKLLILAMIILVVAVITAYILSSIKAKKHGAKIWDATTKRLLFNFCVPLFSGGILTLVMMQYGLIGLVAPITLIFYGLACFSASKYTLGDVKYLGITNIILGLINTQFLGYGLYFWAIGFGVMHIIYGSLMYFKYDRK
ncbi:MAG: hypothetical protein HRT68_05900 [Flavobacteriaceae bacterium]|nr:hypothetical protein [Flavobacteriaceae bacterium]